VSLSTIYTSNTGYMQVVFTSDGSVVSSGFVASWIVLGDMMFDGVPTSTCTDCPTNSNSPAGSAALTNCTCNTGSMGPNHFPCATVICVRLCFSCLYGVMWVTHVTTCPHRADGGESVKPSVILVSSLSSFNSVPHKHTHTNTSLVPDRSDCGESRHGQAFSLPSL
jgi:hypothetical protein